MSVPVRTTGKPSSAPSASATTSTALLQRKCGCGSVLNNAGTCDECSAARTTTTHTHAPRQDGHFAAAHGADEAVRSGGEPLETKTREQMETSFGHDFSRVRVHHDAQAADAARSVEASAYTIGRDIVFGAGRYQPGNITGKLLLAHELTHVAQQERGADNPLKQQAGLSNSFEDEAHAHAANVLSGQRVHVNRTLGAPALQASTLSDSLDKAFQAGGKKKFFDVLRANAPLAPVDPDVVAWMKTNLSGDDLWLAQKICVKGPETLWDDADYTERVKRQTTGKWAAEPGNIEATIGMSSGLVSAKMPIKAYFFPGESDERALIIGGVHGSELAGVEVATRLAESLKKRVDAGGKMPHFTTIIVPQLFPESVAKAKAKPSTLKNKASNVGREIEIARNKPKKVGDKTITTKELHPARQYPIPGESLSDLQKKGVSADAKGTHLKDDEGVNVPLMDETVALLKLIERFKPSRIASIHSKRLPDKVTRDKDAPGVFADPRGGVDAKNAAKTAEGQADDALALAIATEAKAGGAHVPGNWLDPDKKGGKAVPQPHYQNKDKPEGFSLGDWGPVEVKGTGPGARKAMTVITVEVEHYYESSQDPSGDRAKQLQAESDALQKKFLD